MTYACRCGARGSAPLVVNLRNITHYMKHEGEKTCDQVGAVIIWQKDNQVMVDDYDSFKTLLTKGPGDILRNVCPFCWNGR